jgi:uncharacterized membrane protein
MDIAIISFSIVLLSTGLSLHFLPSYSRPDLYFGVTVSPEFKEGAAARQLLHHFRVALWCLTLSAIAAGTAFERAHILVAYLASVYATLAIAHRNAAKHRVDPVTAIDIDLTAPVERLPGGWLAVILPIALLFGIGAWAMSNPATALPGAVMATSAVMTTLAIAGVSCLVLGAIAFGILHASRRISPPGPGAAAERWFRRRILLCLIASEYFVAILGALGVLHAPSVVMVSMNCIWAAALAIFIGTLVLAGQGGTRRASAPRKTGIGDRSPDHCWKGGLFYVNRRDHAILVEKRMGIGYTLNFGNPWSWLLLGTVLAIPFGIHLLRPTMPTRVNASAAASPGSEASLRRYIDSLESGQPNYAEMSPLLAADVKRQLPTIMDTIRNLGTFRSLTYEGVDQSGSDVYDAIFEHGRLEWRVAPLAGDGKVIERHFRRLAANTDGPLVPLRTAY